MLATPGGPEAPLLPLSSAAAFLSLVFAVAPVPWQALDEAGRAQALAELQPQPLGQRLLKASARFLGTPYGFSPLGEGTGFDADPRLRWDRVDCVTFVEETMALSLARRPEEVLPLLDAIRYRGGSVAYKTRNHLMEASWLPANTQAGFVRDVTFELGGADAVRAEKVLKEVAWQSAEAKALALPADAQAVGTFAFGLLPVQHVFAHAAGFPSGTVLVVVREDAPGRITRVSHLGLVVQEGGRTYLRHATSVGAKAVVDEELGPFLARQARSAWKLLGVSLWQVQAPSGHG